MVVLLRADKIRLRESKMKLGNKTTAVCGALAVLFVGVFSASAFNFGKYENAKVKGDVVAIAADKLADGKVHFYKIKDSGKDIAFFAVKATDGSYKTAFDACDACYKSKKGYEQAGRQTELQKLQPEIRHRPPRPHATGGCNPGYLPHLLNGNTITIKANDLKDGARYFSNETADHLHQQPQTPQGQDGLSDHRPDGGDRHHRDPRDPDTAPCPAISSGRWRSSAPTS